MRKSFCILSFVLIILAPHASLENDPVALAAPVFAAEYSVDPNEFPARINIPSIALTAPIQTVGLAHNGEMDVPLGTTKNVGWYKYGKLPGERGNAVMDAHVYAAFKKLRYAKVGDEIEVAKRDGTAHRFIITDSRVYPVADVPMQEIFTDESHRGLVLITCSGKFIPSLNTYSHRLVVFATMIE